MILKYETFFNDLNIYICNKKKQIKLKNNIKKLRKKQI